MKDNSQTRVPSRGGASERKRRAAVASLATALLLALAPSQALAAHPLSNPYCNSSGAGPDDTCYGSFALGFENGGDYNSAFGYYALLHNTTGSNNTASGYAALYFNDTGYSNTASGLNALQYNTTGHENVADGSQALLHSSSGYYDTAVGTNSLISNTTGHDDTAIGDTALYSNTTGIQNTVLGSYAGANGGNGNTTGSDNTFLGYSAGAATPTQLSNATAIGANATVGESNALVLGGTGGNAVDVGIGTTTPSYPLSVAGVIQSSSGGFKFPDGSTQTTSGITTTPGAAGNYLRSNGTSWSSSPIQASDLPPGSNNYIQNTTTQQASANFNIAGNGTVGGILSAGKSATIAPSGGSGTLLQVGTAGTSFGSYVQIPLVQASGAPPASDCNTTSFVGRMVQVYTGKALTLYGCAPTGKWAIEK